MTETLTLPVGWEMEDGSSSVPHPSAAAADAYYGGATMNWAMDGAAIWHLGCCAKKDGGPLSFSIFALNNGTLIHVPIVGAGTGRGWLDVQADGWMYWSSWEGSSIRPPGPPARVPGAVQVQSAGGMRYVAAPNGYIRLFADQDGFSGSVDLRLEQFGIPPAATYDIKVAVDASAAGRILRAGPVVADPNAQTGAMISCRTFAAGEANRNYAESNRALPNGVIRILADAGQIAHGFVDILGWWT